MSDKLTIKKCLSDIDNNAPEIYMDGKGVIYELNERRTLVPLTQQRILQMFTVIRERCQMLYQLGADEEGIRGK